MHEFVPEMELEAFVHGAMCISYSGRCLLSDYLDGRSSNRGACVQSCRWRYEVRALNATNGKSEWLPIEEDEKGTYIFNSKDLNMLAHLQEMEQAGICSFKIEGRMKSGYGSRLWRRLGRRKVFGYEMSSGWYRARLYRNRSDGESVKASRRSKERGLGKRGFACA